MELLDMGLRVLVPRLRDSSCRPETGHLLPEFKQIESRRNTYKKQLTCSAPLHALLDFGPNVTHTGTDVFLAASHARSQFEVPS